MVKTVKTNMTFTATLVLNWKEDGMVYNERLEKSKADSNEKKPSLSLNK